MENTPGLSIRHLCPRCMGETLDKSLYCAACAVVYKQYQSEEGLSIIDFLNSKDTVFDYSQLKSSGEKPVFHYKSKILIPFLKMKGLKVLDAGAREGPLGWLLAKDNYLVGLDICPSQSLGDGDNMLNKGYRELLIADANRIPIAGGELDLVIATDILEHNLQPEQLLKEFRRVLKKGGKVITTVPNMVSYNNRLSIVLGSGVGLELHKILQGKSPVHPIAGMRYPDQDLHVRFFSLKSLEKMFLQEGFTIRKTFGYDPVLSRIPCMDLLLKNWCNLCGLIAEK
ncbi:MAG: class I SAM-dependent methyltransferase [Candidatus Aureabacteria bacterium]|nr:class I SAM-dependent methyltransferase [Candidatus Auribacterota bacterium]